jgi:type II secretion system protein G
MFFQTKAKPSAKLPQEGLAFQRIFQGNARARRGFTLIELLVVMAIMAILTGVVGGSFLTSRIRARDADRKSSISQMQKALELYYNDYNAYPDSANGIIDGNAWGGEFARDNNTFMAQLPSDSQEPTRQYFYETDSTGRKYRLYTRLENLQDPVTDLNDDGTAGDEYTDKTCGTLLCNYGASSPSTTMTEIW